MSNNTEYWSTESIEQGSTLSVPSQTESLESTRTWSLTELAMSPNSGTSDNYIHTDNIYYSKPAIKGDRKQRRKEQNRAAQRAFRERKENYVKELQFKMQSMEYQHSHDIYRLTQENEALRRSLHNMEMEVNTLKGTVMLFNMSMNKLREAGVDIQRMLSVHHDDTKFQYIYSTNDLLLDSTI